MELLHRRIKDKRVLSMFRQILAPYRTAPGKGLPIGSLVFQHIANLYLTPFDHWAREERETKGYVRYMDDFILFENSREMLKKHLDCLCDYLREKLKLELKDNIQLNRCEKGIPFLGYRVFPCFIKLSPRSKRRFVKKFRLYESNVVRGIWSERELVRHMEPLIEFTWAADACGFRREVIKKYGVLS